MLSWDPVQHANVVVKAGPHLGGQGGGGMPRGDKRKGSRMCVATHCSPVCVEHRLAAYWSATKGLSG